MVLATRCPKCGNTRLRSNEDGDLECGCGKIIYASVPDSSVFEKQKGKGWGGRQCRNCHSTKLVKAGKQGIKQRWQCKSCGCVFIWSKAPLGMKYDRATIEFARQAHKDGFSLREITYIFLGDYGKSPSVSTIHDWVNRKEITRRTFAS